MATRSNSVRRVSTLSKFALKAGDEFTHKLIHAAATDAGNASMRAGGRTKWNEDDYNAAAAERERLDKLSGVAENPARGPGAPYGVFRLTIEDPQGRPVPEHTRTQAYYTMNDQKSVYGKLWDEGQKITEGLPKGYSVQVDLVERDGKAYGWEKERRKVNPGGYSDETYQVRFIRPDQAAELFNLYHLARVPLSGTGKDTPYERMLWASKEFSKLHPEVSPTGAYKDLDGLRSNWFGQDEGRASRGRGRRNPESSAAAMYESFHGLPSESVAVYEEEEHYHSNLAQVGVLVEMKVELLDGRVAEIGFEEGEGETAANPHFIIAQKGIRARLAETNTPFSHHMVKSYVAKDRKSAVAKAERLTRATGKQYEVYDASVESADAPHFHTTKSNPGETYVENYLGWPEKQSKTDCNDEVVCPKCGSNHISCSETVSGKSLELRMKCGNCGYHQEKVVPNSKRSRRNPEPAQYAGPVLLCANETGTQLYLVGGDQSIDLAALKIKDTRDSVVIGDVTEITYHTRKQFGDKVEEFDYYHAMGEKGGRCPSLRYDALNERLYIDGGTYKIEQPLIGTSVGIEN